MVKNHGYRTHLGTLFRVVSDSPLQYRNQAPGHRLFPIAGPAKLLFVREKVGKHVRTESCPVGRETSGTFPAKWVTS
jgi:hypothetical protein